MRGTIERAPPNICYSGAFNIFFTIKKNDREKPFKKRLIDKKKWENNHLYIVGEQIDLGFVNCVTWRIRNSFENKKERLGD